MSRNAKFLIVEDEKALLEALESILVSQGYEVLAAENLRDAMDTVEREGPDIAAALIDFWLHDRNAVALIDLLKARAPDAKIVVVSGGGGRAVTLETVEAVGLVSGAVRFIQKPFKKVEILELVASLK